MESTIDASDKIITGKKSYHSCDDTNAERHCKGVTYVENDGNKTCYLEFGDEVENGI